MNNFCICLNFNIEKLTANLPDVEKLFFVSSCFTQYFIGSIVLLIVRNRLPVMSIKYLKKIVSVTFN